jgi:hypothetical protein
LALSSVEQSFSGSLFEFIEVFYNRRWLHSSIGCVSPDVFERRFPEEQ